MDCFNCKLVLQKPVTFFGVPILQASLTDERRIQGVRCAKGRFGEFDTLKDFRLSKTKYKKAKSCEFFDDQDPDPRQLDLNFEITVSAAATAKALGEAAAALNRVALDAEITGTFDAAADSSSAADQILDDVFGESGKIRRAVLSVERTPIEAEVRTNG
jgi:hypothetical protein